MEDLKTFYCTFGSNQHLADAYVAVEATSYNDAHEKMYTEYGPLWAFCYPAEKFEEAIARFGLSEVEFGTANWPKR